jgi:hypothetical protein
MLLNILWAINEYLKQIYILQVYEYQIPKEIKSEVIKMMYWELMNDVRDNRKYTRINVTKYLKMRY